MIEPSRPDTHQLAQNPPSATKIPLSRPKTPRNGRIGGSSPMVIYSTLAIKCWSIIS